MSIESSHDSAPYGVNIDFSDCTPNNTSQWFLIGTDSTNAKFAIYANGNIANSNISYGGFSDERLKTNISEAS